MIDQTQYILQHMRPGTLLESLKVMYRSLPKKMNGIVAAALFMKGMSANGFFAYVDFLRNLNGRRDSNSKA